MSKLDKVFIPFAIMVAIGIGAWLLFNIGKAAVQMRADKIKEASQPVPSMIRGTNFTVIQTNANNIVIVVDDETGCQYLWTYVGIVQRHGMPCPAHK